MLLAISYPLETFLHISPVDIIIDKENSCTYTCILLWGGGGQIISNPTNANVFTITIAAALSFKRPGTNACTIPLYIMMMSNIHYSMIMCLWASVYICHSVRCNSFLIPIMFINFRPERCSRKKTPTLDHGKIIGYFGFANISNCFFKNSKFSFLIFHPFKHVQMFSAHFWRFLGYFPIYSYCQ